MLKLVAFDLDGTIGDTIPMCIAAFRCAVEPYLRRMLTEKEIVDTFGLNEEGMIRRVAGAHWREALDDFYIHYERMHALCPAPFDGIRELIRDLKMRNLRVALATGKGARSCAITLERFYLTGSFDAIETGAPDRNRKGEAIGRILAACRCRPDEMLYVGDTLSDVSSCQEAGVECLSAAWAKDAAIEDLRCGNPKIVIGSVSELRTEIERRMNRDLSVTGR